MVTIKITRKDLENLRDNVKDIEKLGLGKFPQGAPPGTVPVGDSGWYTTPPTPADPQDCDRYPDSPWCGGNPIDPTSPIGYSPDLQVHGCGFDLELGGTVAWVKMPPQRLSYRFEGDCRKELPKPPEQPEEPPHNRSLSIPGADANLSFYCFWHQPNDVKPSQWTGYICPGQTEYVGNAGYPSEINGIGWYSWHQYGDDPYTPLNVTSGYRRTASPPYGTYYEYYFNSDREMVGYWTQGTYYKRVLYPSGYAFVVGRTEETYVDTVGSFWVGGDVNAGLWITKGRWGAVCNLFYNYYTADIAVDFLIDLGCTPSNPYRNNPPPDDECDCAMTCCPDYSPLLQQILNEIKKANRAIGSDEFPASFPAGLTSDLSSQTISIESIARLLRQQVLYLDEVSGKYDIEIQIEDNDLTTEGNQSQTVKIANQAEAFAELYGLMINTAINAELLIQLSVKQLIEQGVTRNQVHNTQSVAKSIAEYLGYTAKETHEKIPLTFTVPENDKLSEFKMSEFLKTSEQDVEVLKIDSKEVGKHRKFMIMLEKTAGIIKAVFWRNLGGDTAALAGKMKDLIKKQNETIKAVDKHDKELEGILEDFEQGYTGYSPYVGDSSKPYGDPYTQRPKTRIIKKPTQVS